MEEFGELMCASIFLSPTFEKGEAGEGFWRACVNSRAAMMAFSADDLYGIFHSVGKTPQYLQLVRVRCGLRTRCGSDNYLVLVRCTNPHIPVFPNFLKWQVYRG